MITSIGLVSVVAASANISNTFPLVNTSRYLRVLHIETETHPYAPHDN